MEERKYDMIPNAVEQGRQQDKKEGNKPKNEFNEKNYLNLKLPNGVHEKTLKIRLLNIEAGNSNMFQDIEFHNIMLSPEMQKAMKLPNPHKSYHCLKKTKGLDEQLGHKCPFCERNSELFKKFDEARKNPDSIKSEVDNLKKESLSMLPQQGVIIRCIERGNEADGPKFCKISLHSQKDDIYNSLMNIYYKRRNESIEEKINELYEECYDDENSKYYHKTVDEIKKMWREVWNETKQYPDGFVPYNIFDLYNGKDFEITVTEVQAKTGEWLGRTNAKVLDYGNPKPLASKGGVPDQEKIDKWVNDPKKWTEVFPAKPYEYLEALLNNKYPFFNRQEGRWIGAELDKDGKYILPWAKEKQEQAERQASELDEKIMAAQQAEMNVGSVDDGIPCEF